MILRCIAVDDEPLALEKIADYAEKVPFLSFEAKFGNPLDAMNYINNHPIDLIFLDIQMDQLTGIQFLETLNSKPSVILTTAYDQYALKGYELDVSDYLLKPFSFERFLKSVNKVYNQKNIPFELQQKLAERKEEKKYVFLKCGTKIEKIEINEITYIEGMKEYLGIHTRQSRTMVLMSFKKLEELLPANRFVRIHKSYSVAIDKILCIKNNHVYIGDIQLPIGNNFRHAFYSKIECRKNGSDTPMELTP